MSKTLRTVAMVAGAVALVATGVGAIAGAGTIIAGIGTAGSIASYASMAATVASLGSQLTAKKPAAKGSVTDVVIQVDPPQPYMMGRTYSSGVIRHEVGYGGEVNDVKNPYLAKVIVYSGAGPIQTIESRQFDYQPIDFGAGWYFGYVGAPGQLGECPESGALTPPFAGMPEWGAEYKLSGQAAVLWNFHFDKKGKKFASGIPPFGIIAQGVRVYDPRFDSTYPGGSGSQRINNEATWAWSENPALHALAYAYGRYQNGKKVFGIGLPSWGIDIPTFVTWANVCDINDWKVGGTIYEPGDKWDNMKDIMAAGGADPVFAQGKLSLRLRAPVVALETVTENDIADEDISATAMQSYRDRLNGVVPKFRSEAHNWQFVSVETVTVPEYVTLDGEEKIQERQYNLVQQAEQAAQLAAYELVDGREMGPITLTLKPQWRRYKPGECLHLYLPSAEIDHDVIILKRELDPINLTVKMTFITETAGKHAFALGQTATPPPIPGLTDPADRDDFYGSNQTSWTWIAYADSIDGTVNFTTGSRGDRTFVGIATNKNSSVESTNPADYQWSASMGAPSGTWVGYKEVDILLLELEQLVLDTAQAALDIAAVEAEAAEIAADMAVAQADIITLGGDVATLESTVGTQGATITSLSLTVDSLEGDLASLTTTVGTQGASITTLQTAVTSLEGDMATLTTLVEAGGGDGSNLLPNGGLENGFLTGIGTSTNFTYHSNFAGAWGPAATATTNGTYDFTFLPVLVSAGVEYTLSADVRNMGTGGGTVYVDMQFRGAGGTLLLDSAENPLTGPINFDTTNGNRANISVTATAPTGTVDVICRFVVAGNTGTAEVGFRRMKLEHGDQWTQFTPEASVRQTFTAISTLDGTVATLSTSVTANSASITTLNAAMSTATGDVATLKTQVRTGSPNLLPNGDFTNGLWNWVGEGVTYTYANANGWGNYIIYAANIADGQFIYPYCGLIPVFAGTIYTASADSVLISSTAAASNYIEIWWYDAGGGHISSTVGPQKFASYDFSTTNSNREPMKVTGTAPTGAVNARVLLVTSKPSGVLSATGWRQVKFERGADFTAYSQEATVTVVQSSVNGIFAKWGVELDVNGYVTGFVLNNNGSRGDFIARVDKFAIGYPGTSTSYPFELVGSVTYIRNAVIQNAAIDTLKVAGNAITANQVISSADVFIDPGATYNVIETGWLTIGDGVSGNAMITFTCTLHTSASTTPDASCRVVLFVDVGAGWVQVRSQLFGVATGSGATRWVLNAALSYVVAAPSVKVLAQVGSNNEIYNSTVRAINVLTPLVSLVGTKR